MDAGTRGCKSVTHVFFFSPSLILFVCGWVCSLRCFVAFRALRVSLSRSVCCSVLFCSVLPGDRSTGGFCPSDEEEEEEEQKRTCIFWLRFSLFFVFLFFFNKFFSSFFDFMVEESSGGICVFGSVRRTRCFALCFAHSGGFTSSRDSGNGFRSGEAVHRRNIMGDDGGETAGLFQSLRGSDGNGDHEGQSDRTGARFWICHFCGSVSGWSSGKREAHHRWQNGKPQLLKAEIFRAVMRVGLNAMSNKGYRERLSCLLLW